MSQKSIDRDQIGAQFKRLEETYEQHFHPKLPLVVRLDGNAFHTLTRGAKKPYDPQLAECMIATTSTLVQHFRATCGYTQSDEISIVFDVAASFDPSRSIGTGALEEALPYHGRINKLLTIMASKASAIFNQTLGSIIRSDDPGVWTDEHLALIPCFDARVAGQFPNYDGVYENLQWRQNDAFKNAATMAACCHFSPRELHKVGTHRKIDMLSERGINFDEFPEHFKRGIFVRRGEVLTKLDAETLSRIPKNQVPPDRITRRKIMVVETGRMMAPNSNAGETFKRLILGHDLPNITDLLGAGYKVHFDGDGSST